MYPLLLGAIKQILLNPSTSNPDFFAPLRTSLSLERGQGTAVFTRASTAYVEDHEGVLRKCKSGEVRFTGARRVENLLSKSEDFLSAPWISTTNAVVTKSEQTFPSSNSDVFKIVQAAGTRGIQGESLYQAYSLTQNNEYILSIYAKAAEAGFLALAFSNGAGYMSTAVFDLSNGVVSGAGTHPGAASILEYGMMAVNDGWYKCFFSIKHTIALGRVHIASSINGISGVYGNNITGDGNSGIYITRAQLEDVSGQTVKVVSEYVSNGAPVSSGNEIIVGGDFTGSTNLALTNFLISSGEAVKTIDTLAGAIELSDVLTIGKNYRLEITYNRSSVGSRISLRNTTVGSIYLSPDTGGTNTILFTASATKFSIIADAAWTGSVDNISLKEEQLHGCNVDGVKYFDYENGNTVVNNVLIEARGPVIPESKLKGYLTEGQRTNLFQYSNDPSNAYWTRNNCETVSDPTVQTPDGGYNAIKATQITQINGPLAIYKTYSTVVGLTYTFTRYFKAGTSQWGVIYMYTGGQINGCKQWFDLSTGTIGTAQIMGTGLSVSNIKIEPAAFGWYKCTMTVISDATSTTIGMYFSDADYNGSTISRTDGKYGYIWESQLEQASFESSIIPTTSASLARAADVLTYPSSNINPTAGSCYAELTLKRPSIGIYTVVVGFNVSNMILGQSTGMATNSIRIYEAAGKDSYINYGIDMQQSISKTASKWTGLSLKAFKDGRAGILGIFSGKFIIGTPIYIGTTSNIDKPWSGTIKNVKIWKKALNDNVLMRMTA